MNKREPDFVDEYYADKNLSQLEKLTLIIPTYNRNYYLSRCLWYHAHFPFHQIIVADSSPEEKKVVNRNTISKIQAVFGTDILYLEYTPETEQYGGDIYRKWGDAVQHVETEYSQFCTDKEFLIPTSLNECISYLFENPDYITAEGVVYQLKENLNAEYTHTPWQDVPSVDQDTVNDYDKYSRFHVLEKSADGGKEFILTLVDNEGTALAGMEIGLSNGDGSTTMLGQFTDENGQVSLTLDQEGIYCVTAKGTLVEQSIDLETGEFTSIETPIIAPVCMVTVV